MTRQFKPTESMTIKSIADDMLKDPKTKNAYDKKRIRMDVERLQTENKQLREALGKTRCRWCGSSYAQNTHGCDDVSHVNNFALLTQPIMSR